MDFIFFGVFSVLSQDPDEYISLYAQHSVSLSSYVSFSKSCYIHNASLAYLFTFPAARIDASSETVPTVTFTLPSDVEKKSHPGCLIIAIKSCQN